MSIARDVILDLVPLYLADEASPASRALVEAHLAEDPELARRVRAMAVEDVAAPDSGAATLPPELALRALQRTRSRLRWQRWLFAIGTTCVALLLSFRISFDSGRPTHFNFLFTESPAASGLVASLGAAAWLAYFLMGRGRR